MKKLWLALAALLITPAWAQEFPPPPKPGYNYTAPWFQPTYSGAVQSTLKTAGDIYCIQGSQTMNVQVSKLGISATGGNTIDVSVVLRSSANTPAGTNVPLVSHDSINPAPTAVATVYNTAPTPGNQIGVLRITKLPAGLPSNSGQTLPLTGNLLNQPFVLRGTSQFVCVNVSAMGITASFDIESEHTEITATTVNQ